MLSSGKMQKQNSLFCLVLGLVPNKSLNDRIGSFNTVHVLYNIYYLGNVHRVYSTCSSGFPKANANLELFLFQFVRCINSQMISWSDTTASSFVINALTSRCFLCCIRTISSSIVDFVMNLVTEIFLYREPMR